MYSSGGPSDVVETEKKIKLLDSDRKAYFEASQMTIKQNRDLLKSVKQENQELREAAAKLNRDHSAGNSLLPQQRENQDLEVRIRRLKSSLDTARFDSTQKSRRLDALKDQYRDLEKECAPAITEDSPLTKQIRILENRLEKAVIKHNEALSIRKTYEQIVKRLKEERVGFDNQLSAIERTLKAKVHDHEELETMCHDAAHARDVAKAELANFRKFVDEQRAQRLEELEERKQILATRQDATRRISDRIEERERVQKEAQNLSGQDEKPEEGMSAEARAKKEEEDLKNCEERIAEHERIFRIIKDATGVSDVNLVIQKFLTQEDTHRNLENLVDEGQSRIDTLTRERNTVKHQLEELKYSGTGTLGSRRIVDEFEDHLNEAKARCDRNRKKFERVSKVLIDVKAGIDHLMDKLEVVQLDGEDSVGTESIVDKLALLEKKLMAVMKKVSESDQYRSGDISQLAKSMDLSTTLSALELPETNIRIKLPTAGGEDEMSPDEGMSSEGEEEVMNREQLKRIAHMTLEKQKRKPRKKRSRRF